MKTKINILIVVIVLALVACLKNDIVYNTDDLDYRGWTFVVPPAKIHVPLLRTMDKYIDFEGYLDVKNGYIVYTHSESFIWSNEIGIENVINTWSYHFGQLVDIGNATFRESQSHSIKLKTKGADDSEETFVNEAVLISGNLKISLTVPNDITTCDIELSIPGLTRISTDVPYSERLNNLLPGTTYEITLINLNGFKIKTDQNHLLKVECVYFVKGTAVSGDVDISFTLDNAEASYLSGYFGQVGKKINNSRIEFDFFDKLDFNGTFGFDQGIELEAKVTNWTGIPAHVEMKSIKFDNDKADELLSDRFMIDVLAAAENQNADPAISRTTLNKVDFIKDDYPTGIIFEIDGTTNPNAAGNKENFIKKNGNDITNVDFTFTVPLVVKLKEYNRYDTVEFDYKKQLKDDLELHNSIKEFVLNLLVDNNLPFKIILSVHAVDEDGKPVGDYLVENEEINVNENNKSIIVDLTREQLDKFWNDDIKNIVIHTQAETLTEGYWPVKEDNYLDVAVSVRLKSNIPFNIL